MIARVRAVSACMISVLMGCERPASSTPTTASAPSDAAADVDRLRALPYAGGVEDDPESADGVVDIDPERSYPGYNLYVLFRLCTAELIDPSGTVVQRWKYEPGRHWDNCELLPDGDLVVTGADPTRPGLTGIEDDKRFLMRIAPDNRVVWKRPMTAHHDVEVTPQGGLLTLSFERRVIPEVHAAVETRDDAISLLDMEGTVVDRLGLYDVLRKRPEVFRFQTVRPEREADTTWVDLFHCNSVEWMRRQNLFGTHPLYSQDYVLVCSRHQDRVFIVDFKRRELVWAWGEGQLDGPHDATLLESGRILLFDNGLGRGWSRVLEVDPRTNEIAWEYKSPNPRDFYTKSKGSCQRLPNGNTLIANSDNARAFEVTPEGETVWEWVCPYWTIESHNRNERATIVRLYRIGVDEAQALLGRIQQRLAGQRPG